MPDPMTMMMIMNLVNGAGAYATQNKGETSSTYNPQQLGMLNDVMSQVKGMGGQGNIMNNPSYQSGANWLQDLFNDPGFFNKFEAPMMRQYEENTIPDLANRFAGMGSGGALGSTGFRNQATREAGNLHANMAAMRGGMQQQGANQALAYGQAPAQNYMQMLQQALQPTQNVYQPPSAGPFGGAFAAGTSGMMQGMMNQGYGGGNQGGMNGGGQGAGAGWDSMFRQTGVY